MIIHRHKLLFFLCPYFLFVISILSQLCNRPCPSIIYCEPEVFSIYFGHSLNQVTLILLTKNITFIICCHNHNGGLSKYVRTKIRIQCLLVIKVNECKGQL